LLGVSGVGDEELLLTGCVPSAHGCVEGHPFRHIVSVTEVP
jgi:hypothetical protein